MNPVWHFVNGVPNISAPVVIGPLSVSTTVTSTVPLLLTGTDAYIAIRKDGGTTAGIFFGSTDDVQLFRGAADTLTTPDRFVSTGPVAGIGYATGAGGAATQGTSKSTTVVLNTVTGEITMHNAALNAGVSVSFTLTNSGVALGDMVLIQHVSAGTVGAYVCQAVAAAGSATVTVTNRSAGNLSEAIVLKYVVFKAVTS